MIAGYSLAFGEGNAFIGDLSKVGPGRDHQGHALAHDPRVRVRRVPGHVRDHHARADAAARSPSACASPPTSCSSRSGCSRSTCPLAHMVWGGGLDRRGPRREGLRGRAGRAHVERLLGARRGDGARAAPRLRQGADAAAQPAAHRDRRGTALGGLVRLQRRQRARRGRHRRARLPHHQHRGRRRRCSAGSAIEWLHRGKPTVLGAATAAVAGLVAITPACAFVTPIGSIWIGVGAAVVCYAAVTFVSRAWATTTRSTCSACTASAARGARSRPACSSRRSRCPRA